MVHDRRIALLCQHFYPEMISTGMHMTELALGLTRVGWEVTVYCAQPTLNLESDNQAVPERLLYQGISIVRVPTIGSHGKGLFGRFLFALSYLVFTAWTILRERHDIRVMLITTNPPFIGIVGRMLKWWIGKPYALLVYDVYPDIAVQLGVMSSESILTWFWERLTRFMLNGAQRIVVIGRDMSTVIGRKLNASNQHKLILIPNWSDEESVQPVDKLANSFRAEHINNSDTLLVQYSGRMARTHNLEPLIEAAELLQDTNVIFQFIGDGAKKQTLQAIAIERGLTNIQFLPYQPLSRLNEVLSAADLAVVCLGSAFTGLSVPSKAYGIMASGTPILGLVAQESETGKMIIETDCGVVLPNPTGLEVAKFIEMLHGQPERREQMGQNGYVAFQQSYTLTLAAQRYNDMLAELLQDPY